MAETPHAPRRRLAVWPLVLAWLAVPFQCAVLTVPLAALHILHSFVARRRHAYLSIVASPVFVLVVWLGVGAAVEYATGRGKLRFAGLPSWRSHNLDPETRCYRRTSGCVTFPDTDISHGIHNAVLRMLVRRLGPMRGSWTGAYPGEAETFAALSKPEGTVKLEGRRLFDVREDLGFTIRNEEPGTSLRLGRLERAESVDWATVADDVVALGATSIDGTRTAVLVSRSRGEAFAVYERQKR